LLVGRIGGRSVAGARRSLNLTLPAMRVIITRPAGDAPAWVDALQTAGYQALALPLIEVGPASHPQPVVQAWAQWPSFQAVMFVSAQAVRYFFDSQPAAMRADAGQATSPTWLNGPRCWATGPGTHKALREAGVPEACIDSPAADAVQFDSEALWQRVAAQVKAGQAVLIVRGHDVGSDAAPNGTGRDWLAQQLRAAGASPQFVVAYERHAPLWSAEQKRRPSVPRRTAVCGASAARKRLSIWSMPCPRKAGPKRVVLPRIPASRKPRSLWVLVKFKCLSRHWQIY